MKNINGYWIDGNNNRWNENIYTKEQAVLNSRTLVHCSYCRDCSDCRDCSGCSYCRDCRDCSGCSGCRNCSDCRNCSYCSYCRDCRNCRDCSYCRGCSYCSGCSDCSENPQRYTTAKIGSRNSNTTFYWIKDVVQVVCDCFRGNLQEFEDKVKATYGRKKFGLQYTKEIKKVKYLIKREITK